MTDPTSNGMLTAALDYAARAWPVIPLHTATGGQCSCGKADCSSPAKHPRTRRGLKDASTDPATIAGWWPKWPAANVGIVTGTAAGIIVIDIDPRHGGHESLAALEAEHGELMRTLEAATGGGGRHLIYRHPGGKLGNRANVRPGIDLRGDGGYIVAAPSLHASGRRYAWPDGGGPDEREPGDLPGWLHEVLTRPEPAPRLAAPAARNGDALARLMQDAGQYVANAAGAAEGGRNQAAFSLAGHLTAFVTDTGETLTVRQIIDLLRPWNHRNTPPLAEAELVAAARSAMTNGTPRAAHEVRTAPRPIQRPAARPPKPDEAPEPLPFVPFPVDALPEPLGRFVTETAAAMGCDPTFVALPALAAAATAIGTTRAVELLERSWDEYPIVWAAVVARSGGLKSPAFDAATEPLWKAQFDALREHEIARKTYESELSTWDKRSGEPKPEPPTARRYIVSDCTVEALAPILAANPRGVLLARDELAAWVRSFDAYKAKGRGGDAAAWIELQRGGRLIVDRKGTGTVCVPRAAVSVCGTIQPGTLEAVLKPEYFESGLAARLLLARPPERLKQWTKRTPARTTVQAFERLIRDLLALRHAESEHGPEPVRLPLAADADALWGDWFNQHARRIHEAESDRQAAVLAKLEAYAARFGLLFALIVDPAADAVSADALRRGIALADWFAGETERVYGLMGETDEARKLRRLVELIGRKGGGVTARELQQSSRQYRTADDAEAALAELVKAGFGRWEDREPTPKGGRPTRVFRVNDAAACLRNRNETEEIKSFVDVDSVDWDALRPTDDDIRQLTDGRERGEL